jgi:hypothetical protein
VRRWIAIVATALGIVGICTTLAIEPSLGQLTDLAAHHEDVASRRGDVGR